MIDITLWMERSTELFRETFGERIYFVGLQGSYGRGEATEASDIADCLPAFPECGMLNLGGMNRIIGE